MVARNEIGVFLIDAVVGEVLEPFVLAVVGAGVIFLRSKSGQPFLIDIDPQGVDSCDRNIDSQVELQPIDEEWVFDVVAHDHR